MSKDLAVPESGLLMPVGLEDYDVSSDGSIPRLKINGVDAVFEDNLTGEEYEELTVVMLGLVKQRTLWGLEMDEDNKGPLCRANDHTTGIPKVDIFPWDESGFDPSDVDRDNPELPCSACRLKEWGSAPGRDTPWCTEVFQFPLLMPQGDDMVPAIVQFQRSGMKPARKYVTGFVRSQKPLFTRWTTVTLTPAKRGSVRYAVPEFKVGGETDSEDHAEMANQFKQIRDFLQGQAKAETKVEIAAPKTETRKVEPSASVLDIDEEPF